MEQWEQWFQEKQVERTIKALKKNNFEALFVQDSKAAIEEVKKRLEGPLKGIYKPDPRPRPSSPQNQGACEHCAFPGLCGFEEQKEEDDGSEDKE